jgi:hypothetical protein
VPLADAQIHDAALLELFLRVGDENGQLCRAVHTALADERFTRHELQQIRGEVFDLVGHVMAFLARIEGLVDD